MTFREGVCSNRQSTVIWGEGVWPNRHVTFIVAKKLNLQFIFSQFTVYVGEGGWLKASYGGRGLAEKSEYRHKGGGSLKLLKNRHMIFERAPSLFGKTLVKYLTCFRALTTNFQLPNHSLYSPYNAEACNELAAPISEIERQCKTSTCVNEAVANRLLLDTCSFICQGTFAVFESTVLV